MSFLFILLAEKGQRRTKWFLRGDRLGQICKRALLLLLLLRVSQQAATLQLLRERSCI